MNFRQFLIAVLIALHRLVSCPGVAEGRDAEKVAVNGVEVRREVGGGALFPH